MRLGAALAGLVTLGVTPAVAVPAQYDIAFVSEFADACVPQRISFPGTKDAALAAGWTAVERSAHPELDAMMAMSEAAAADPELQASFEYDLFSKPIEDIEHHLVVTRMSAVVGEPDDAPFVAIGCYLYNFEAAAPIDPEVVTALIGNPVATSQVDMHINGWVWGPPPAMPRTLDTYLTFIPETSQFKEQAGFTGLVLKFSTSEPEAAQ